MSIEDTHFDIDERARKHVNKPEFELDLEQIPDKENRRQKLQKLANNLSMKLGIPVEYVVSERGEEGKIWTKIQSQYM